MPQEPGFELTLPGEDTSTFVPINLGTLTTSKAMRIIDRCTQLPVDEFAELLDDPRQRRRGPMLQAMIGLSLRNANPTWSAERVMDIVDELDLSNVEFLGADEEDEKKDPLSESESETKAEGSSLSPSDESSQSATPTDPPEESELSNLTPA